MKKIYEAPKVKVVKVQPVTLMAGSETLGAYGTDATSDAMSRGRGVWDDDEEDYDY